MLRTLRRRRGFAANIETAKSHKGRTIIVRVHLRTGLVEYNRFKEQ
jgi:hypothetical protein